MQLNNQDPLEILAYQYDLVCNGVELSSGAVRNHDPEIMIKAFELVGLGEADVKAKFPAMYNAFCYGAPPHAGIAPGVDRMIMLICGEESIREIIPFPMNKNAMDIMMGAPGTVEQKQLDELSCHHRQAGRIIMRLSHDFCVTAFMLGIYGNLSGEEYGCRNLCIASAPR